MKGRESTDVFKSVYVQTSDPAAEAANSVLAGKLWLDTTDAANPVFKVRNVTNTAWIIAANNADKTPPTSEGITLEHVDDRVNVLIQAGANITKTYDDANNTLTISATAGTSGGGLTIEDIDDRVNALIVAGANITKSYDDANNTLLLSAASGGGNTYNSTVNLSGGNMAASSAYASLEAAFTAIGNTAPTTLMVNSTIPVSTDLPQPSNIVLFFVGGGRVNKTGAGKLTGLQYFCADEYQICFSGFAEGDILFGRQMPTKVSYCHFGAAANDFGGNTSATGVDTLPAVKLVEAALTHTTQDNMPQGTTGYLPQGDFYFSGTWTNRKNIGISGVENNTYWAKATRLFFPIRCHGVAQKRGLSANGNLISRTIGNIMKNFEVIQNPAWYTDSTIKIAGSRTFAPSAVDVNANTIILAGHLFDTGERVSYTLAGTAFATPLNDYSGDYYVIKVDADTIKLAANYDNAAAGTAIDLTSQGAGTHRITGWEMRYTGGGAIDAIHVAEEDFGFPLNDGATIGFADGKSLMVLRVRRTATWASAGGGTNVITGSFRQSDAGADIVGTGVGIREAKILTVAADGASATINTTIPDAFSGQGFYANTSRILEIVKPIFVLRAYAGATVISGHNSKIHNGSWCVGQPIRFYHPSGDVTQDFYATVTAAAGNSITIDAPLPARFGGPGGSVLFTTAEIQGLTPMTNEKVRLNKWSGIYLEEYNFGQVEKVQSKYFAGNGFTITTDPQMQFLKGNCNMVTLQDCFSDTCAANGVSITGQDSNACRIINQNVPNTDGFGIRDDSYLGCTINEGHYADCNMGVMWTAGGDANPLRDKGTTKTAIHDVYVEGGTVGFNLGQNTAIFGGVLDCGFHPKSRHSLAMAGATAFGDIGISGGIGWAGMNKLWSARINARPVNKDDTYFLKAGGNTPVSYDVANDWAFGAGNLGTRGYVGIPNDSPTPDYILAWDFAKRTVLTRGELQIGDGTNDTSIYTGMISAGSVPAARDGGYPRGFIAWNRNYAAGAPLCWVNKTAGQTDFDAVIMGGTSPGGTSAASSAGVVLDAGAKVGLADGNTTMQFTANGIRMTTLYANSIFLGGIGGEGFAVRIGNPYSFVPTTANAFDLGDISSAFRRTYTNFVNKPNFTPANSADTAGIVGDEASDDNFFYKKTASGWKRAALTAF